MQKEVRNRKHRWAMADEKASTVSFARKLGITYPLLIHPTLMTSESEQQSLASAFRQRTYWTRRAWSEKGYRFPHKEDIEQARKDPN
jgi:hypothetical protein